MITATLRAATTDLCLLVLLAMLIQQGTEIKVTALWTNKHE